MTVEEEAAAQVLRTEIAAIHAKTFKQLKYLLTANLSHCGYKTYEHACRDTIQRASMTIEALISKHENAFPAK